MLKIMQKWAKMPKISQKKQTNLKNSVKKQKIAQLWKISTHGPAAAATFFHLWSASPSFASLAAYLIYLSQIQELARNCMDQIDQSLPCFQSCAKHSLSGTATERIPHCLTVQWPYQAPLYLVFYLPLLWDIRLISKTIVWIYQITRYSGAVHQRVYDLINLSTSILSLLWITVKQLSLKYWHIYIYI